MVEKTEDGFLGVGGLGGGNGGEGVTGQEEGVGPARQAKCTTALLHLGTLYHVCRLLQTSKKCKISDFDSWLPFTKKTREDRRSNFFKKEGRKRSFVVETCPLGFLSKS